MSEFKLLDRLETAYLRLDEEEITESTKSIGYLRTGNTGIMSSNGEVAGQCHRLTHLRSLGLLVRGFKFSDRIMFDRGYANEDIIVSHLKKGLKAGEVILREEDIPARGLTVDGTPITGRPDIVIARLDAGKPVYVLGIEAKSIASVNTAYDILVNQQPVLKHLIQAAQYAHMLGIPYKLHYRNYANLAIPKYPWFTFSPQQVAQLSDSAGGPLVMTKSKNPKYPPAPNKFLPFEVVFDLQVIAGKLRFKLEGEAQWRDTIVSAGDAQRYFEFVAKMPETRDLGPRPQALKVDGSKAAWTDCQYCPLDGACGKQLAAVKSGTPRDVAYEEWVDDVRVIDTQMRSK